LSVSRPNSGTAK